MMHQMEPNTPNKTKRAMMRGLSHSYLVPPHCKHNRSEIIAGRKAAIPMGSILWSWLQRLSLDLVAVAVVLESSKNNNMTSPVRTPKGKLIQKHHLQLARSVRTPPSLTRISYHDNLEAGKEEGSLQWTCDRRNPTSTSNYPKV